MGRPTRPVGEGPSRLSAADRRASIVAAAGEVFSEVGYQRGTMSEVARRLGVTEPVIFQNFGSKAAVFVAVLDTAAERLSAAMRERVAAKGSVGAWLGELLAPGNVRRLHVRGSHGALFADAMSPSTDPQVKGAIRRAHRVVAGTLADLVARGQEEGGVRRDVEPETCAWWLLSFLASHGFRTATMPDRRRLEAGLAAMTLEVLTTSGSE